MFNVTVHGSLQEFDEAEWDSVVAPGAALHGYRALRVLEEGGLIDCPARYFCFRDEQGALVAHATAYLIRTSLVIFARGRLRDAVAAIRRAWPGFLQPRMLECGCPIGPDSPICARGDADTGELLQALAEAAEAEAARCRIHIVAIRDFRRIDLPATARLYPDFALVSNLPTTTLDIQWRTFEDYLSKMRSKYRTNVRRGMALAERAGLTTRVRFEFADSAAELEREWHNVHDHADEASREEITAALYGGFGEALPGRCRLVEVMRDGHRVAHALAVIDGRWLRWLFFGRDRPEDRDGAYFLAAAAVVRLAIDEHVEAVEMGLTTYKAKTDFGAEMIPQWVLIRFRSAILRRLMPVFMRSVNPVPVARRRKAFQAQGAGTGAIDPSSSGRAGN